MSEKSLCEDMEFLRRLSHAMERNRTSSIPVFERIVHPNGEIRQVQVGGPIVGNPDMHGKVVGTGHGQGIDTGPVQNQ